MTILIAVILGALALPIAAVAWERVSATPLLLLTGLLICRAGWLDNSTVGALVAWAGMCIILAAGGIVGKHISEHVDADWDY